MVKFTLSLPEFPACIVDAIESLGADAAKVLVEVNQAIGAGESVAQESVSIRSRSGKDETVTVDASGKLKGIKLPKECPASHLARICWYLNGSRELYLRVDAVTLPLSVLDWLKAKRFSRMEAETVEAGQ